jgi:uncharacterized protein
LHLEKLKSERLDTGTLGILVKVKQAGYLSSVAPVIAMLQSQGMWLADKIINEVLRLLGEGAP